MQWFSEELITKWQEQCISTVNKNIFINKSHKVLQRTRFLKIQQ